MRALLIVLGLLSVLFAGCSELVDREPSFQPTCPAWTTNPSTTDVTQGFSDSFETRQRTDQLGAAEPHFRDHPLDRVVLDFGWAQRGNQTVVRGIEVINSTLSVSFFAADGSPLSAYRPGEDRSTAEHTLTYPAGAYTNFTLYVDLSGPDEEPDPQAVTVQWDWQPDEAPATKSAAIARYVGSLQYRTC